MSVKYGPWQYATANGTADTTAASATGVLQTDYATVATIEALADTIVVEVDPSTDGGESKTRFDIMMTGTDAADETCSVDVYGVCALSLDSGTDNFTVEKLGTAAFTLGSAEIQNGRTDSSNAHLYPKLVTWTDLGRMTAISGGLLAVQTCPAAAGDIGEPAYIALYDTGPFTHIMLQPFVGTAASCAPLTRNWR